jgi:phosphoribosylaminoimidazolecarboxamide formyltransferase / IMP cyclohydrolase
VGSTVAGRKVGRAILSVSNKEGVVRLGRELAQRGVAIISTGGTAKTLAEGGVEVTAIREITKNEKDAYFSGRMKTISFQFESALLFDRDDEDHRRQAEELGIEPIDLVVCNLYPFEQTIAKPGCTMEQAIEQIDIGGPCMIRAGSKNWKHVAVITSPDQYEELLRELDANQGRLSKAFRLRCALAAFEMTASYDRAIATYLTDQL